MSEIPPNVNDTTQRLADVGIVELTRSSLALHNPPIDPEQCQFWVEAEWTDHAGEHVKVVVREPNGNMHDFTAMPDIAFGWRTHPPLNAVQQQLVDELAEEWRRSHLPE